MIPLANHVFGFRSFIRVAGVFLVCWTASAWADTDSKALLFEESIRPVLLGICGECHGPEKQKGGLRLDSRAALLEGGSLGPALIPGDPDQSLVIQAVRQSDPELAMPPKSQLSDRQVALLSAWVQDGAYWPAGSSGSVSKPESRERHWAYQAVGDVVLPPPLTGAKTGNPIDRFIGRRLAQAGLSFSPGVDRRTLIRRAYWALTGLPAPFEAIQAFETDTRPDAFERVVDELLARPEYGEHWARHWLDVARYADAKGYVDSGESKYAFAYTYRDYVVGAFNADLPFDRFVREQLAADRLPDASPASLAGLGFLTVGSRYNIFPHEIIDDRIDVVTRGFLGLSVACARCHDHKYDPIPTEDYYTLYGVFAGSAEPTLDQAPIIPSAKAAESADLVKKMSEAGEAYREHRRKLHAQVSLELRAWAGDYLRYVVQTTPEHRTESQPELQTKRGLIREVSAYATGGVWRWRRYLKTRSADDPVFGLWVRLGALSREQFERKAPEILQAFGEMVGANPLVMETFADHPLNSMADVADGYAVLLEGVDQRWRAAVGDDPSLERLPDEAEEQVRQALYQEGAPGTLSIEDAYDYCTLDESVELRQHFARIEQAFLETWETAEPRPMMMVDREITAEQRVFVRGNPLRLGSVVDRAVPVSLGLETARPWAKGSGRLELAQSITAPGHPLLARVIVNRVWDWHFGQGLVASPSDFGTRAAPPTHPNLLDYLAADLVRHGWSLKRLQRQILLSATWQQSSRDRPEARAVDPDNRWYWRQNRRHVSFEMMRDGMLQLAGHLETRSGGPPLRLAPDDPGGRARTLYGFIDREKLADLYRVFDFPSPDITAAKRASTTVPQQTLFLLNSPFVLHQAGGLLSRVRSELVDSQQVSNAEAVVARLFQRVYGRSPSLDEQAAIEMMLAERARAEAAGEADAELAWVDLAQTLILSNEFLFVD